jgi:hypothetical protein
VVTVVFFFGLCLGSGSVSAVVGVCFCVLISVGRYAYLTGGCALLPYAADSFVEMPLVGMYSFDSLLF